MLFLAAPALRVDSELISGWAALVGIVFLLHFGTFHLAALFWRSRGRDVKPIMNAPIMATSVTEFWSRRWESGFSRLCVAVFIRAVDAEDENPLLWFSAG